MNIDDFFSDLVLRHPFLRSRMKPCTTNDLEILEGRYGVVLPNAYSAFLLKAGRSLGRVNESTEIFLPELLDLTEDARRLLHDNGQPFVLADDAFVFWMHQGYEFLFFNCSQGDNPNVLFYSEGYKEPKVVSRLSEYLQRSFLDFFG